MALVPPVSSGNRSAVEPLAMERPKMKRLTERQDEFVQPRDRLGKDRDFVAR